MKTIKDIAQWAPVEFGDLAFRVRWALLWFGLVGVACVAMWGLRGAPLTDAGRARKIAESAAQMSLSGPKEAAKLAGLMTPKAWAKAQAERRASGLDEALSSSGAKVDSSAWTVRTEKSGDGWISNGFAKSSIGREGAPAESWVGAWRARSEIDQGRMKVTELRVVSLPDGSKLDDSAFAQPEDASSDARAGLRMDSEIPAGKP